MLPLGKKFALVLNIDHALSEDEILTPPDTATDGAAPSVDVHEETSDETLDDADWEAAEAPSQPTVTGERAAARS